MNLKFFQEEPNDETLKELEEKFTNWNKVVESKLSQTGTPYIAGDKLTAGDFLLFAQYSASAANQNPTREKQCQACANALKDSPAVNAWIERMREQLGEYLAARPKCSI